MHLSAILMSLLLAPVSGGGPVEMAQLTIEQHVIIRVPLDRPARREKAPPPVRLKEKKGPKCVPIRTMRAAAVSAEDSLDILMADGRRYRARLEHGCRAVDFWSGFYIEPTEDGALCAGRDVIQARGGTECGIDVFRLLVVDGG